MGEIIGAVRVYDQEQAEAAARRWLSPRYVRLDMLERYVCGTQYEGRADFLSPRSDTPLLERAPNIVHSLAESAIRQHIDFALGQGRWPSISTAPTEDDMLLGAGLPEEVAQVYDAFVRVLVSEAQLEDAAAEAMAAAESCGTAVSVVSFVDGLPVVQQLRAKWCTPTFARNGRTLIKIEVLYPYVEHYQDQQRNWRSRAVLFRRVVDDQRDTVYQPMPIAADGGVGGAWKVDTAKSAQHDLGFCPVVWHARRAQASRVNEVDGHAVHETQLDELDALNFALSQRGRAAIYSGDPQAYEIGVDNKHEQPAPTGRAAIVARNNGWVFGMQGGGRSARKKGAGVVWQYTNTDAKVGLLTLPGDALAAITQHATDIEDKIAQVLGYTKASPETVRGAMSGKALGFLYQRTTSFVDGERRDFWHGWIVPVLEMLMRMVAALEARSSGSVLVTGATKVAGLMQQHDLPRMRPTWGAYFTPTSTDERDAVSATTDAYASGVIPLRLALEKLRAVFPHESSESIAEELEQAHETSAKSALEKMRRQQREAGELGGDDAPDGDDEDEDDDKATAIES